jgi:hypothetical protein
MPTLPQEAVVAGAEAPDARTFDLAALSDDELRGLVRDAQAIAERADGLSELFAALATDAATERRGRASGGEPHVELDLSEKLETDPREVVLDQRDAMARAVELRDDASASEGVRDVWAVVVERLGLLRREAKAAILERRRDDETDESWRDAQIQAEVLRRQSEAELRDAAAEHGDAETGTSDRDAGPTPAPAASSRPDAPVSPREAAERAAGEPAPWQPEHARVGSESGPATTPSSTSTTEQLVRGPGMAGGTGGAGSQNAPADTGLRTGAPLSSGDREEAPPDVGHR